jgi:hypothetical protein
MYHENQVIQHYHTCIYSEYTTTKAKNSFEQSWVCLQIYCNYILISSPLCLLCKPSMSCVMFKSLFGSNFEFRHNVFRSSEVSQRFSYNINHTLCNLNAGTDNHQSQPLFFGHPGIYFTPGTSHHPIPHTYDCALA